jgi:hypothetical protein
MGVLEVEVKSQSPNAAKRMRRYRERWRRGIRSVRVQLDATQIQVLISKGCLGPSPHEPGDLEFAINAFLQEALDNRA